MVHAPDWDQVLFHHQVLMRRQLDAGIKGLPHSSDQLMAPSKQAEARTGPDQMVPSSHSRAVGMRACMRACGVGGVCV